MSTVLRGHVESGRIVVVDDATLPEGAEVKIELVAPSTEKPEERATTLYERLKDVAGIVKDYPSDFAENHDHYIHGRPKK